MSGPIKLRRRPVEVEAMQMPTQPDIDAVREIVKWIEPGFVEAYESGVPSGFGPMWRFTESSISFAVSAILNDEDGIARLGDWIVRRGDEFTVLDSAAVDAEYERPDRLHTIARNSPVIQYLLREGRQIEAIRELRRETNCGLSEARVAIEEVQS